MGQRYGKSLKGRETPPPPRHKIAEFPSVCSFGKKIEKKLPENLDDSLETTTFASHFHGPMSDMRKDKGMIPSYEGTTPSIEGVTPSIEGMIPSIGGMTPSIEGITPSIEGMTPSIEGMTPSIEGMTPSNGGITGTEGLKTHDK
jgi:hypothetical protein